MRPASLLLLPVILLMSSVYSRGDEPIFSGPQVGEELVPFHAQGVFGDAAGKRSELVHLKEKPVLLVFVHQLSRPAIGLTRLLMHYANDHKEAGLVSHLVFLSDDVTETESWMRRARRALPETVDPVIFPDGIEGPGAYGLNRKMSMTVLVGNEGKVTANFPLIQPSIQADGVKIGAAIAAVLGKKKPTLKEMGFAGRQMMANLDNLYRRMMLPVIQKGATDEEVTKAASAVEELAATNKEFKARVHKAASLIVSKDRLANYGTPKAQAFIKKWATEMAPSDEPEEKQTKKRSEQTEIKSDTKKSSDSDSE